MSKYSTTEIKKFLDSMNRKYAKLHNAYEENFWLAYMGDPSYYEKMDSAMEARDAFRANEKLALKTQEYRASAKGKLKERLGHWVYFFELFQAPQELLPLKRKIADLESKIMKKQTSRKEGYIDPTTKRFKRASRNKLSMMMRNSDDARVRKACFRALEELAVDCVEEYVQLVQLRNQFARGRGFEDFYAFKLQTEERMRKSELFAIFDKVYTETKHVFKDIRKLEKKQKGLRAPWNFSYMMSGDFTKEEDPYFQFDTALGRWGRSFQAMGIHYQGGALQLDLLDRKGKYSIGFCHWPKPVYALDGKLRPGLSNFTCNLVPGQVGAGHIASVILFHEGGHAAHYLNSTQEDIIVNHEYAPSSVAWAETQSMFLDGVFSSAEWKMRYAKNSKGESYPWDLYERKVRKLALLRPLRMMSIMAVSEFERIMYESKKLTPAFVKKTAKEVWAKYFDLSHPTLTILNTPHIYSWESSAYYHGYGLATLALTQWREYFYKKYGYIVDNKRVGKEMQKVWKLAAAKSFPDLVKMATGKKLSPSAYIKGVTKSVSQLLREAKIKIARISKVPESNDPIRLGASIRMVHGKRVVADNVKSFEDMTSRYSRWLKNQK